MRTIQPGWKHEWKKPSQLINQQLLNVRQVIPGPFTSPHLLKISPFIIQSVTKLQTGECQTEINEKKFCQGIPDPWMEYVALQEIRTKVVKNSTEYILGGDNTSITKAISKIGVPFEQGIPNPWKVYSLIQFIKMIDKNQANNYNIQINELPNKIKSKTKKFMKTKDNNSAKSNSSEPKIRDKNLDKLKILSSKTCVNDPQNENYFDNSQIKSDNMNLICCRCNYSYLKFRKFDEHQEQWHEDDNCKSPNAGTRKMKNPSKNAYVNVTSGSNETCISKSQSIGKKSEEFYLANLKVEKSMSLIRCPEPREASKQLNEHVNDTHHHPINFTRETMSYDIDRNKNLKNINNTHSEEDFATSNVSSLQDESSKIEKLDSTSTFEEFSQKYVMDTSNHNVIPTWTGRSNSDVPDECHIAHSNCCRENSQVSICNTRFKLSRLHLQTLKPEIMNKKTKKLKEVRK